MFPEGHFSQEEKYLTVGPPRPWQLQILGTLASSYMGNLENKQSSFHCYWISLCTENHQKLHPQGCSFHASSPEISSFNDSWQEFEGSMGSGSAGHGTWAVFCSLIRLRRLLTDMIVEQMIGFISEMSVPDVYDVNDRVEESCCGLISLLAQSGFLKGLKWLQSSTAICWRRSWVPG